MDYVGLMLRVKRCSCKLFLTHQLDASGSREGFLGGVSSPPEFPTSEINICTTQGEERHPKDYFWTNISHQEGLFKESYPVVLSIFCASTSVGLMGRPSSLAKVG